MFIYSALLYVMDHLVEEERDEAGPSVPAPGGA
jgi:hypothetical protein